MTGPRELLTTDAPESVEDAAAALVTARAAGGYHPSPADWRDEVLYFLLPDRFSDEDVPSSVELRWRPVIIRLR